METSEMVKLYKEGKSAIEIAEMVKLTPQSIYWRLERAGIKRRTLSEAVALSFKTGRAKQKMGINHPKWKGGRYKDKSGYIYVDNGRTFEHRKIWEKYYGKIPKGWIIHHLNGIRDDNRIENLAALPRKRHSPIEIIKPHQERIRILEKEIKQLKELKSQADSG